MKQVQQALADIGIPVFAGIWRATSPDQNPPVQYVVYSSTTTENSHQDDHVTSFRTYVYMNLWSDIDPTDNLLIHAKYFIRRIGGSPIQWFGLETSNVIIEYVPLFLARRQKEDRLERI